MSTTSTIKKRLILNDNNNHASKKPKKKTQRVDSKANHQEPKLAAYDIDWFDSALTQNKCLKHTSSRNLPSAQEEQLTVLLSKYQAYDIKTALDCFYGPVLQPHAHQPHPNLDGVLEV
jgi:hypothetical protein